MLLCCTSTIHHLHPSMDTGAERGLCSADLEYMNLVRSSTQPLPSSGRCGWVTQVGCGVCVCGCSRGRFSRLFERQALVFLRGVLESMYVEILYPCSLFSRIPSHIVRESRKNNGPSEQKNPPPPPPTHNLFKCTHTHSLTHSLTHTHTHIRTHTSSWK